MPLFVFFLRLPQTLILFMSPLKERKKHHSMKDFDLTKKNLNIRKLLRMFRNIRVILFVDLV